MRELFGRSALDYDIDGAPSGPVRVRYFDPRTGEPCNEKPRPLRSAGGRARRAAVGGKRAGREAARGER